jgi:hypothetical protein
MKKSTGKTILVIIALLLVILILFLAYMGVFKSISFEEKEMGPYVFAYQDHTGDYAQSGPVFEAVYETLLEHGIETELGLGIYYDDPAITPKEDLQSKLGSIITREQADEIEKRGIPVSVMTVDKKMSLVTEFPIRNNLSYFIGPMKVYPAMEQYMIKNDYKTAVAGLEIYDMDEKTITIFAEIADNNS